VALVATAEAWRDHVERTAAADVLIVLSIQDLPDRDGRMRFELVSDYASPFTVSLPVRGEHMVMIALLAAAVGLRCGIDPAAIAAALGSVRLTHGRLGVRRASSCTPRRSLERRCRLPALRDTSAG
jgi:UDP-N-acetylmuramyl pentapeptide synthase